LHSHNSNPRKSLRLTRSPSSRSAGARHNNGLRSGRHRTLLANDAQTECQETPRKPRKRLRLTRSRSRKRLRLTRSREKMDSSLAGGFAPHPGDAGGGGAIHPRKRLRLTRSHRLILTECSMCTCYVRRATLVSTLASPRICAHG